MTYTGRIMNGLVVLDNAPAILPEGEAVRVEFVDSQSPSPTLAEQFKDFIGKAEGLPVDMAENRDHYIHGTPKRFS